MTLPTPSNATVCNSSCLIALEATAHLDLLQHVYQSVLIPPAVASEWGTLPPQWLLVQPVINQPLVQALLLQLGRGEAEAIALAVEIARAHSRLAGSQGHPRATVSLPRLFMKACIAISH